MATLPSAQQPTAGLKQRKVTTITDASVLVDEPEHEEEDKDKPKEEIIWGKTPDGTVFRVPTTHDVLTSLFDPRQPKSHLDALTLFTLSAQIVLFIALPRNVSQILFVLYFAFWRTAYDAGLGWVLTQQSKKRWVVREVKNRGWMDKKRRPQVAAWIQKQLEGKMGKDYDFDTLPIEYNTWLIFRQFVDIILLNDFVAYCMFAFSHFRVPNNLSMTMHLLRWICGFLLIAFNWWVKTEAHHVVKDYGWYWGDVFFARGNLVFDGVFEMAPHPMYSVGYAGYYGLSLIVGSYAVMFVSLAAHAAQFGFLLYFENPHIARTYGQKKMIAQRTPLVKRRTEAVLGHRRTTSSISNADTPDITEAETTESEDEPREPEIITTPRSGGITPLSKHSSMDDKPTEIMTAHDLLNRYFHKDAVVLWNLDLLRSSDFTLVVLLGYVLFLPLVLPKLSERACLIFFFLHALAWRLFHSFGLGLLLKAQSERKWIVRHFIKHYHFPGEEGAKRAIEEAFDNWKSMYNLSLCMTYTSFGALAFKTYHIPVNWTVGGELLRHTLGFFLVFLHIWTASESFKVLGLFGWFFGDFFIEDFPVQLDYSGIYRYLNNPEKSMSGAAVWGLALLSGSKLVFALAVITHLAHWWFLSAVEMPHMKKLYGDTLRKEAGFTRTIRKVATKNARLLESRLAKQAPEIKKVAEEVRETLEKAFEETADAFEEFLAKSQPKLVEVMQETRSLIELSKNRLILPRVSSNLSSYDKSKYSLTLVRPSADGALRWHIGEPIHVKWNAPSNHSRRDWIGLYRVGASRSRLVTEVNSQGHWRPIVDEEWDGDTALHNERPGVKVPEHGEVTFGGKALPWRTGNFELRYHHDGMYNVMALSAPFEIYVDQPSSFDYESVHASLAKIVVLGLDSDPALVPACTLPASLRSQALGDPVLDAEDFRFYSADQAKRIAEGIKQAFGIEFAEEVIVADAKLSTLTKKILEGRELLAPFSERGEA
ncbi:phosphatidylethanolamine N-methyltransferase [Calocera viscosa TUFC12733]|uniref:Phosphatidylethanolamine N-methyltransferase n=1 Tax=Calocera viscosa (strain TUFC12733) TaxID=1330018 RepID=A0A167N9C8_CALVF|nr:phosphatidylethanolamine N-methyltransferase [Calocera viscosa TUFC12733]